MFLNLGIKSLVNSFKFIAASLLLYQPVTENMPTIKHILKATLINVVHLLVKVNTMNKCLQSRLSALLLIGLLLLTQLNSCTKEESNDLICNTENPIEELKWLNNMVRDFSEYEYIRLADYKGQVVFYNVNCDPLVNYVSITYNCKGEALGFTGNLSMDFSNDQLLWKPDNSVCDFNMD